MGDNAAGFDVRQAHVHVSQRFELVEKSLVARHVDQNGDAPATLCKDDGPAGVAHVLESLRRARPEVRHGSDV